MAYYITKLIITALLIVIISEISKRSSFIAAILASVPLVSVLAMIWLYIDTKDVEKVSSLATSVFWLVLPSLSLFIVLPMLLRNAVSFHISLSISLVIMITCYFLMIAVLGKFGIKL